MRPRQRCTLLYCAVRSHSHIDQLDQLSLLVQRLGGWFAVRPLLIVDFWVPESRLYLLYLIDPLLERQPRLDYVDHRD